MTSARTALWPKEHGAYAQLGLPLATALALAPPSVGAVALCVSAVCGFLAHEPALVLAGRRGARARSALGTAALRRLWALGLTGCGAAALGVSRSTGPALWGVALSMGLALLASGVVVAEREKTLAGELFVATTLVVAAVPCVLAGDRPWADAAIISGTWCAVFWLGTTTVHGVLRQSKMAEPTTLYLSAIAAAALSAVVLTAASRGHVWPLALAAPCLVSFGVALARPRAKHLRRVGWTMVVADLATASWLIVSLSTH